ncbi:hypothetical protein LCGC14_0701900 [marine sediment metagenome]|uniref:Uncharacterized protein n=1 Tax=marine sediment metagenome TaxID=412755 RepID=A0A0F9TQ86_9ZZZZ
MSKRPNVYIRIFSGDDPSGWDGESIAYVFLGFKPWNEMFHVLSQCDPDRDFFSYQRETNCQKWDVVAAGSLMLEEGCSRLAHISEQIYYPCATIVRARHKNKGYGDLLYKALIMAAIRHAKKLGTTNWTFGTHRSVGGSTSTSAMRVYKSLVRKRYLKPTAKQDHYLPGKTPKNFTPVFY